MDKDKKKGKKNLSKTTTKTPMRTLSASAANTKGGGNKQKASTKGSATKVKGGGKKVENTKKLKSTSSKGRANSNNNIKFTNSASNSLLKCTDWKENSKFSNGNAPAAIEFMSFAPAKIPEDWASQSAAKDAAFLKSTFARCIGFVKLTIDKIDEDTVKMLLEESIVAPYHRPEAKYSHLRNVPFNTDGEISTPQGQIPLSRLVDGQYNGLFKMSKDD